MQNNSLYRLYRPQNFSEVVGQTNIVAALKQAVLSSQIAHAYLFCGTRGTGKTTLAKILARAINCTRETESNKPCNECSSCRGIIEQNILDVIEMDAASNNSVEDIRRLCDEIIFAPTVTKYKVYIIDEVHMLSTGAFNALLKTLEEPPAHAVFILATTEPHRIPATILSRCQRYDLKSISLTDLFTQLKKISEKEQIQADDTALQTLAQLARGSLRDALSLLDQCRNQFQTTFGRNEVLSMVGLNSDEDLFSLIDNLSGGDFLLCLRKTQDLFQNGQNPKRLVQDLIQFLRDVLVYQLLQQESSLLPYPEQKMKHIIYLAQKLNTPTLKKLIIDFSNLLDNMKKSLDPYIQLEVFLLNLIEKNSSSLKLKNEASNELTLNNIPSNLRNNIISETKEFAPNTQNEIRPTVETTIIKEKETKTQTLLKQDETKKTTTTPHLADVSGKNFPWSVVLHKLQQYSPVISLLFSSIEAELKGEILHLYLPAKADKINEKLKEPKVQVMLSKCIKEVLGEKLQLLPNFKIRTTIQKDEDVEKILKVNKKEPSWHTNLKNIASEEGINFSEINE